jgi:hypothetical protein
VNPLVGLALTYAKKYWWLIAIALALASTAAYVKHLRDRLDALEIERNNALAAADTLKVKYAHDSTVVVGILAFTRAELAGLRGKLAKGAAKAVTTVTVAPKPKTETHAPVTTAPGPAGMYAISDSVVGPPVDAKASVAVAVWAADSTLSAQWSWSVRPTPFALTVDVGCLGRNRPDVLVRAPAWVTVDRVSTEVTTDICGKERAGHGAGWWALRLGAAAAAGAAGAHLVGAP